MAIYVIREYVYVYFGLVIVLKDAKMVLFRLMFGYMSLN
jgi:hypothetical protein